MWLRSGKNYPHVLAERLGADLTDVTISGATTATILDAPQITVTGISFPPQLHLLSESADLVTITAGGNDLGYAGSMLVLPRPTGHGRIVPPQRGRDGSGRNGHREQAPSATTYSSV